MHQQLKTAANQPIMRPALPQGATGGQHVRVRGTPAAVLRLGDIVDGDWLFSNLSPVGREKLLREHDLVAA
jgi:hypothetical protein